MFGGICIIRGLTASLGLNISLVNITAMFLFFFCFVKFVLSENNNILHNIINDNILFP